MSRVRDDKLQARMRGGDSREIILDPLNITVPDTPVRYEGTSPIISHIGELQSEQSPLMARSKPDSREIVDLTIQSLSRETSQNLLAGYVPKSLSSHGNHGSAMPAAKLSSIVKFGNVSPNMLRSEAIASLESVSADDFYNQAPTISRSAPTPVFSPESSVPKPIVSITPSSQSIDLTGIDSPNSLNSTGEKRPRGRPIGSNKKYRINNTNSPTIAMSAVSSGHESYANPSLTSSAKLVAPSFPMIGSINTLFLSPIGRSVSGIKKRGRPRKYTVDEPVQVATEKVLAVNETRNIFPEVIQDVIEVPSNQFPSVSLKNPVAKKRGRPRKTVEISPDTMSDSKFKQSQEELVSGTEHTLPKNFESPSKRYKSVISSSSSLSSSPTSTPSSSLAVSPSSKLSGQSSSDESKKMVGRPKGSRNRNLERDLAMSHPGPKNLPVAPFKSIIKRNGRATRSTTKASRGKLITIRMKKILRLSNNIPNVINAVDVVSQVIDEYLDLVIKKNKEHHQLLLEEELNKAEAERLSKSEAKLRDSSAEFSMNTLTCYRSIISKTSLKLVDLIDLNKKLWKDVKQAQRSRDEFRKKLLETRDEKNKISQEIDAVRADWREVQEDHEWSQGVEDFVQAVESEKKFLSVSSTSPLDFSTTASLSYSNISVNSVLDRVITKLSSFEDVAKRRGTYGQVEDKLRKVDIL